MKLSSLSCLEIIPENIKASELEEINYTIVTLNDIFGTS